MERKALGWSRCLGLELRSRLPLTSRTALGAQLLAPPRRSRANWAGALSAGRVPKRTLVPPGISRTNVPTTIGDEGAEAEASGTELVAQQGAHEVVPAELASQHMSQSHASELNLS